MALEEVQLATKLSKPIIIGIAVVVVGILVLGWLWWNSHETAKNAAAVPAAQAKVNGAQATAGGNAVNAIQANQDKNAQTDAKTGKVTNVFNTYPAAQVPVDHAFFDAFRHGVCMYKSAADLPECVAMQQPNP